jgi:hypothetical protein
MRQRFINEAIGPPGGHRTNLAALIRMSLKLYACLCLALPGFAAAQQPAVQNPHGELTTPCEVCHSPTGWRPAHVGREFDHAKAAGFSLLGAHKTTACRNCHATLDFRGTSRDCASCHADPHRGEVGTDCSRCHTSRSFLDRGMMTRAHQLTRFPLTGTHVTVDCEACHARASQGRLRFVAVSTECSTCHLADYQAARDPDHAAGGFSTECAQCHAPITWLRTNFDHASTGFALTGMHLRIHCSQCHGTGSYQALPSACVSCHQTDYDNTTNPNHQTAAFPTDCALCHSTLDWTNASFTSHDALYFPIYSGTHRGRWSSCATCHVDPSDYRQFDCLSCHGPTQTASHHQEVSGYVYDSQACYSCHRRGGGGG